MKKKIITTMFVGAMLPFQGIADSDVGGHEHAGGHEHGAVSDHHTMHDQVTDKKWELYGALYMAMQSNYGGSALSHDGEKAQRNLFLTSDGTTIGFRGAIPLDDELKAVWQIESVINLDEVAESSGHGHGTQPSNHNDSTLAGGHNNFLGLTGGFGTVLAGKHNTPFFDATIQFDLFHHLPGDARALLGSIPGTESGSGDHHASTFNASAPDMIMYKSPKMGGFSAEAAYFGMNETLAETNESSSAYGIGARYAQKGFILVAAYEQHNNFDLFQADLNADGTPETYTLDTTTGIVLGGMVHFFDGQTMVGAFVEQLSASDPNFSDADRVGYYVNFQQRFMGKNKFKFAYASANEFEDKDAAQNFTLGYVRELGTATEAYIIYSQTQNDEEAAYSNGTVGPLGHGGDPSTLAFGLVHSF